MKKWYQSKTVWVNAATIVAAALTEKLTEIIEPCLEVIILAGINLVLRAVTKEKLV